jgi:hypothetical protein
MSQQTRCCRDWPEVKPEGLLVICQLAGRHAAVSAVSAWLLCGISTTSAAMHCLASAARLRVLVVTLLLHDVQPLAGSHRRG